MRKIKKINGYLIVKFNAREMQKMEQLGAYGVIDAELYTGHIEIDLGAMEYEDAETLEIAIEQARSLKAEFDVDESATVYTVIKETNNQDDVTIVDPMLLAKEWDEHLQNQVEDNLDPDITPETAQHEFYGFITALRRLGIYDSECVVGLRHLKQSIPYQPYDKIFERKTAQRKLGQDKSAENQASSCISCPLLNKGEQLESLMKLLQEVTAHTEKNHLKESNVLRKRKYTAEVLCSENTLGDKKSSEIRKENEYMKSLKKKSKKKIRKVLTCFQNLPAEVQVFTYVTLYHTLEELHFQKKYEVVSNVCDALLSSKNLI